MAHEFKAADAARCKADFLDCPVKFEKVYEVTRCENRLVWVTDWAGFTGGPYPVSWFEPAPVRTITTEEGMAIAAQFAEEVCAHIETSAGMLMVVEPNGAGYYTVRIDPPLMRLEGHEHCERCHEEVWDPPSIDLLSIAWLFDDIRQANLEANAGTQFIGMHRGITIDLDIGFVPSEGALVSGIVRADGSWKVFDEDLLTSGVPVPPKHEQN